MKPQIYESKTAPVSKRYEADSVSKKDITILRLKENKAALSAEEFMALVDRTAKEVGERQWSNFFAELHHEVTAKLHKASKDLKPWSLGKKKKGKKK